MVKNLLAVQETWVRSLGQEDPLRKEMAIHSSILAWRIPWTEGPGGLQSRGHKESDTTKQLSHIVNCREKCAYISQLDINHMDLYFILED